MKTEQYNTEHLTTEEVREVVWAVWRHWQAVIQGEADKDDVLYADPEELSAEYEFWSEALSRRLLQEGRK